MYKEMYLCYNSLQTSHTAFFSKVWMIKSEITHILYINNSRKRYIFLKSRFSIGSLADLSMKKKTVEKLRLKHINQIKYIFLNAFKFISSVITLIKLSVILLDVVANELKCEIIVSEFNLESCCYVNVQTNNLVSGMHSLICTPLSARGKIVLL